MIFFGSVKVKLSTISALAASSAFNGAAMTLKRFVLEINSIIFLVNASSAASFSLLR
jgi:hypothetical protein